MLKKNELRAEIIRHGFTVDSVAKALGIDSASMYRKMNGKSDFYRGEIESLNDLLELSDEEMLRIFFAPNVANFATEA